MHAFTESNELLSQTGELGGKQEVVLRLLRGETLKAVSRDVGVPRYPLADWRDRVVMGIPALLHKGPGDGRARREAGPAPRRVKSSVAKGGQYI